MGLIAILLGVVIVVAALLHGRSSSKNSVKAKIISGPMIVGDIKGPVSQSGAAAPAGEPKPDRIAWVIGVIGAVIAAVGVVLDHWPLK